MKVTFHVDISAAVTIDLPAKQARKLNAFADTEEGDSFTSDKWPDGVALPWREIENQIPDTDIEISQVTIVKPKKTKAKSKRRK
jgi:hypothetical protein